MVRFALVSAAILASGAFTSADAQGVVPYRGVYPNPYYEGRSAFGDPAPYCQKLCTQDFAPCDPPEYKHADGRCNNPAWGRF